MANLVVEHSHANLSRELKKRMPITFEGLGPWLWFPQWFQLWNGCQKVKPFRLQLWNGSQTVHRQ